MNTIVLLIIYVVSGALQPVLIEILNYNGACEESTLIFLLPTYLGMSLSFLSDLKLKFSDIKDYKSIGLLCLLDIISQTLNYSGLIFAGSLVFTILYSSCTMWAALFSRLILYKKLHNLQWMGVFIILIGLLIGSLDSANEGKNVFIGVILILSGSMLHSLTYIVSEIMLSHTIDPSPPEIISSIMGITGIIVFGAWQIIHTLPNYRTLVIDNIASHHGSLTSITFAFLGLAIDSLIHIPCLFYMIGRVGATTTGVLKGVQTLLVFVISHFAFCSFQKSQCFTPLKGVSVAIVVIGVFAYSFFKKVDKTDPFMRQASVVNRKGKVALLRGGVSTFSITSDASLVRNNQNYSNKSASSMSSHRSEESYINAVVNFFGSTAEENRYPNMDELHYQVCGHIDIPDEDDDEEDDSMMSGKPQNNLVNNLSIESPSSAFGNQIVYNFNLRDIHMDGHKIVGQRQNENNHVSGTIK